MSTTKAKKEEATIQDIPGGYHLVTYGEWQVSVMNDGMISLPRLVRPQDIDDFCKAMEAAKDVGLKQQAENEEKANKALPKPGERSQRRNTLALSKTRRERNAAKAKIDSAARQGGPRGAGKTESKKPSIRSRNANTQGQQEDGEGGGTAGS
jgi:hypothetical protein